jgi:hypothetical protein
MVKLCSSFPFLLPAVALFVVAMTGQPAESSPGELTLKGIVCTTTNKLALIEGSRLGGLCGSLVLGEGQRESNCGVEVLSIDEPTGRVRIKNAGAEQELTFDPGAEPGKVVETASTGDEANSADTVRFRLQQTGLEQAFTMYQMLAGRTLLMPANLPRVSLSLRSKAATKTEEFLAAIERALAEHGVEIQRDGEMFAIAGRDRDWERITPQVHTLAQELGQSHTKSSSAAGEEIFPAGRAHLDSTTTYAANHSSSQ